MSASSDDDMRGGCPRSGTSPTREEFVARGHQASGAVIDCSCGAVAFIHPRRLDWSGPQHLYIADHDVPESDMPLVGPLKVNLLVTDTGEVKEWAMDGKDDVRFSSWDEETTEVFWQVESLPLALNLVPDLMDAIERARKRNEHVEVVVRTVNSARTAGQ